MVENFTMISIFDMTLVNIKDIKVKFPQNFLFHKKDDFFVENGKSQKKWL